MYRVALNSLLTVVLFGLLAAAPPRSAAQCCGSEQCAGDLNCDGQVTVDEIITAINNALGNCVVVGADQACGDLGAANCAKLDQCVLNGSNIRYGGGSTCQARQKNACLARLNAPGIGNNPAGVEQCVSDLPAGSCSDFDLGNIPECEAHIGNGVNGAPCAFPGQCASSNCALVTGTACGTCAPPTQAGDSCATASCSHGFTCVSATQLCQPVGNAGAACDADHPCGAGVQCVTPAEASMGTCTIAGTSAGVACDPQRVTAPGCAANAGLYCNGSTQTCAPIAYVTAGAPCGSVNHGVADCTNASTCFGSQGSTPGTCVADAADGMPCDTQVGPACVPPAVCVTGSGAATGGTCRLPDATACH